MLITSEHWYGPLIENYLPFKHMTLNHWLFESFQKPKINGYFILKISKNL